MLSAPLLPWQSRHAFRRSISIRRWFFLSLVLGSSLLGPTLAEETTHGESASSKVTIWKLGNIKSIGGLEPVVIGEPKALAEDSEKGLVFNGKDTGLEFSSNPIAGLSQFTIEVFIAPDPAGEPEQRFLHIEDEKGGRALMEIRLKDGSWALDTFLATKMSRLPLFDGTKAHPAGKWTWVALVYDGKTMRHFINGEKELEGVVDFPPSASGKMSLGVRLNRVYWYKGAISEVRFHPSALEGPDLQKTSAK